MKALTIWQPWASLIMAGAKPYEFRGWAFPASYVGQRIVIHAGKRKIVPAEVTDLAGAGVAQPACNVVADRTIDRHDAVVLCLIVHPGTALCLPDNRTADCAGGCGRTIQHRPHVAVAARCCCVWCATGAIDAQAAGA